MPTFRTVIDSALRRIGVLGAGQTATPDDYADALLTLQGLFRSLITTGAFGRLRDVTPQHSYTAGENERIYRRGDDPTQTISLPDMVPDRLTGWSDYGRHSFTHTRTRPIRDGAVVTISDRITGKTEDFIHDGQRKVWFSLDDMAVSYDPNDARTLANLNAALDAECPLSMRDVNGLASTLAISLSADYGSSVPESVTEASRLFLIGLTHNYSTPDR
jgi:hypothetical protein